MAAEFKIGRLRFTWMGVWTPSTLYARDDVVSYQGKTYVCLLPNTSDATSFYNDLYYVTQTGASTPYWNMIVDGKTFVTANGGGWQTAQAYSLGNIVTFGGVVYYCNTKHTSTNFASQSSYWTQYTEFNAWRSVGWLPNNTYGRNDVVKYGGIVYKCITNHTSAATTALGLEANQSAWTIVDSGIEYKGTWISNTRYKNKDVVKYGPDLWIANSGHTSVAPAVLSTVTTANTTGQFSYSNGSLVVGQAVTITGQLAATATGSISGYNGTTTIYYISATDGTSTFTLSDTYAHAIANTDQLTTVAGTLTGLTVSINGFDQSKWAIWMPGFEYSGSWSNTIVYQPGDTVAYGGYTYYSKTANNIGNTPSIDATDWSVLTQGFNFRGEWGSATNYRIGDVVRRHGIFFDAVADNTTQDPSSYSVSKTYSTTGSSGTILKLNSVSGITVGMNVIGSGFSAGQTVINIDNAATTVTLSAVNDTTLADQQTLAFVGVNYINWKVVIPGRYWTKTWIVGVTYTVGDLVVWQNGTYVCVQTHQATAGALTNRPDADTANIYWIFYIPHARKNAMNTVGDLEYYSSTTKAYTALPTGTDQYTLKAMASTTAAGTVITSPAWNKINQVGAVYYVSGKTGIDRADYGTTWDQPWKTIAYACNFIGAGTIYPNSTANIVANKSWLTTEMYYWMISQKALSANGFTPSSVFDQTKTIRDAGYVIDAIVYDMSRGGNSQTVAAALAYFAFGSSTTITNATVLAELPYFIAALNQLGTLIQAVLLNSVTGNGAVYQTANSITPVVYQKIGLSAELGSSAVASSLLSIITTALTSQSTALVPAPNSGITASIFVKTGNYFETLPITVPENTAIIGDELRSVTVAPAISLTLQCTATSATSNLVTVNSTGQFVDQTAVQFVNPTTSSVIGTTAYYGFGRVTPGVTYYVVGSTITSTQFKITASTGTYYSVTGTNLTATGTTATFNATPAQDGTYTVTVAYGGSNYLVGDTIRILSRNLGIAATNAGLFVSGFQYTITSVGTTDFTLIGAASNTVGLRFTATGVGSGTGTATTTANDITITVSTVDAISGAILTLTAVGSTIFPLVTGSGSIALGTYMTVYAGDCIKDMFRLRNGTGLRNMTVTGLLGSLTNPDEFYIQKPTGGSYACLDPGTGPNDTTAWIFRRSPYVQNVTAFGNGVAGLKIDGTLHNGGNKSIVANDFTHIISDGIGVWCTGPSSLTEVVSVFSYYGYTGYFAEAGGRIRATNGNTSYGTYGVIAEGYDVTEVPATGIIFNQSSQVQAAVQSAFGSQAQLVRLTFSNSGSSYNTTTTNLLNFSNNFLGGSWVNDSNVTFNKNTTALTGLTEAWAITGNTGGPDGSYVYQNISVPAAGAVYSNLTSTNITGSGGTGANNPALFNVTVTATAYAVTVSDGGAGYVNGNTMFIAGSTLGGIDNINDCIITVTGVSGNVITGVSSVGTVPINSALSYTLSAYVKKGTSSTVSLYAIFSGSSTATSNITYNFDTGIVTPGNSGAGLALTNYGAINQQLSSTDVTAGWIRIWFSVYDTTGLNTQLQYRLYPRGYSGSIGQYTYVYGAQTELSKANQTPSFYLEVTNTSKYTAYANYNITGAGTGVVTIGDEIRSASVFQSRVVTDSNGITGGAGYLTASNNAQGGTPQYVQLSQSDTNTNGNYTGMRIFIQGGSGAGQYGYISYYNSGTKVAWVLKESFATVPVTATASSGNLLTTTSSASLYLNQPVQFIPTYYTTSVNSISLATTTVSTAVGGTTNTFTVASTTGLVFNQAVTFSGTTFSTVNPTQTYYIFAILDGFTIQITNQPFGTVWQLNSASGSMTMNFSSNTSYLQGSTNNMVVNYPIQFTGTALGGISVGTVYYINEVINPNSFTISANLITLTVTASTAGIVQGSATAYWGTNYPKLTMTDTSSLIALNPVVFSSPMIGGLVDSQKYYIAKIVSATTIAVSATILTVTITKFEAGTNLITASSTTGFQQDYPIRFVGAAINAITPETTYYISAINNGTTFTITTLPGQAVIQCTATTTGYMTATTCPQATQVTTATGGSMALSSTSKKSSLTLGIGAMNATFSTQLFGGPQLGQTYYIQSIPDSLHFSVSLSTGTISGTSTSAGPVALADKTGSMSIAEVGWDHINPGTPMVAALDSSSQYYIEPRTIFSQPSFIQSIATSVVALSLGTTYTSMVYGNNYWIALASSGAVAARSSDGSTWTSITLPGSSWSGIAYGNGYWVIISGGGISNSVFAISKSNGAGWRTVTSPPSGLWSNIAYGNGTFSVIASNTNNALYSINYGNTWSTATLPSTAPWSCMCWGGSGPASVNGGRFVALANGVRFAGATTQTVVATGSGATFNVVVTPTAYVLTLANGGSNYTVNDTIKILGTSVGGTTPTNDILITVTSTDPLGSNAVSGFTSTGTPVTTLCTIAAYSATGASWVSVTLPASGSWCSVTYGNGIFVAVANGAGATPVYSLDGQVWYAANTVISADKISYGQGVFVAVSASNTQAYTSENGLDWKSRTVTNDGYSAMAFGFVGASGATQYNGVFATLAGRNTGSTISAGCQTKARASITSNTITSLNLFEPGSGYTTAPTVSFVDPNVTTLASISPRLANGVLSSPTFANRGSGYNTNSTAVIVSGNGFSDQYQTGLQVILNNLTRLPSPGDNLTITGISQIFKVTSAFSVFNTVAPNLEANVSVSPSISTANSTANGTVVSIRSKYSQARLTNHDFLNIGYGDFVLSNYPNFPIGNYVAAQNNQSVEANYGRVFFTSTDQDGNFKVGNLFGVQQATGIVTLSASQFGLTGLSSLSLGGIAVGGSSVVVSQFSTDSTFTANSDSIIPTQRAIKKYLTDRLSAGGANTFTGQLTAGTTVVGGPNFIRSTVPAGVTGSNVKFKAKANFVGPNAAVDGNLAALSFYARNAFRGRQ
jgi:hypothetical protein